MADPFELCRRHPDFRPLSPLNVTLDLRYASEMNITGRDLYQGEKEAWLHREAFVRLEEAIAALQRRVPWRLRIYDAARPLSVQRQLFAQVQGTPEEAYVADPQQHSVHNYGLALDLGLENEHGQELDLGTPFDSFDPLAQPRMELECLAQGRLSTRQRDLRMILRESMLMAGFIQHPLEWWHFDAKGLKDIKGHYLLIS
jgi:zinc D-Ala-D-Ala dipeptidase